MKNLKDSYGQEMNSIAITLLLTSKCNMKCIGCYARFKGVNSLSYENWIEILKNIDEDTKGIKKRKINFAGGEPFLFEGLSELVVESKKRGFTTKMITNGYCLNEDTIISFSDHLDWLGISVDSFNKSVLRKLGRTVENQIINPKELIKKCNMIKSLGIKLKINTLVSRFNYKEDMTPYLNEINPHRWKVLKFLKVIGQNDATSKLLDISDKQFEEFIKRHNQLKPISENNDRMKNSYLMISPNGKLFDNKNGEYCYSQSLLEVPLKMAIRQIYFDYKSFLDRNGDYDWNNKSGEKIR